MPFPFHRLVRVVMFSLPFLPVTVLAATPTLMRFPSSSATQIAFVARGDLWLAPRDGGSATRLVKSDGELEAARFSPDGQWIAYTQWARSGRDVYVVSANGGAPRRLTSDARRGAVANLVVAWSANSQRVVFLSDRKSVSHKQIQAFSVSVTGGMATRLPLSQSGTLAYSPDGAKIAYTRTFTDLASRKRYVGGQAEDLFLYDVATHVASRITDWKGTDTAPMWSGRHVYFLSDRGPGWRLNLWRYDLDTQSFTQITHFADLDVDWPAIGAGRITFQQGGRLWALELPDERLHALPVDVPDDGARTAARQVDVANEAFVADATGAVDYALSGDNALLTSHGDLFRVSLSNGQSLNLTSSPGVDEQHPAASPDGRQVAYITEDEQAQQVAVRPIAGGAPRQLTHFMSGVLYQPRFSPDGRWLAVASAEHELWLLPLDGGAPRRVAFDPKGEIRDAAFSQDGRWLAYSTLRQTGLSALHLQETANGRDVVLSSALDGDRLPAFSADGATLYFVSRRHERVLTSDRGDEATLATIASDGIYALPLDRPGSKTAPMDSAWALPVPGGRIVSLDMRGNELFYQTRPVDLLTGEEPDAHAFLHAFDVLAGHDRTVVQSLDNHALAADGRSVLFHREGRWHVQETAADATRTARTVDVAGLFSHVDPRLQWRETFEQAWRLDRDLFFSRVMNGSDWQAVHDAYVPLVPLLGSRADMLYLLRQLQGEMATSHAFVYGSDAVDEQAPLHTPMLGADFALDARSGRYYLARSFPGDPTRGRFRSPLNAPETGLRVPIGTYVLAINGSELHAPVDPDSLLAGLHGAVSLTLADTPDGTRKTVQVQPVSDDLDLRQHAWIEANRARVAARSGGRVGYVFLSNFVGSGAADLMQQLQGQLDKQGLIIDIRWSPGGFTSQAVLGLLRRVHAGLFANREGAVEPLPLFVAPRAMAVITNEETFSDGDQFAYFFRAYGLGPVIGQRTLGGVQGIRGEWPLMDGIEITIPKDSLASTDGHWLIENEGVTPDITVAPQPDDLLDEQDLSLDAAIEAVLHNVTQMAAAPLRAPAPLPAYPAAGDVPPASFGAANPSQRVSPSPSTL